MMKLLALAGALLVINACTTQAWYEGARQKAINDCQAITDSVARQQCLQQLPDYQHYHQQREQVKSDKW